MTITTLTIEGSSHAVYATIAEHDAYLAADIARVAVWGNYDEAFKSLAAVGAARMFQRLNWNGSRGDAMQPLPWPRAGEGTPDAITQAAILLAAEGAADPSIFSQDRVGSSNVRRVQAGSVSSENFRPENGYIVPFAVMALISPYLGSTGLVTRSIHTGCCEDRATTSDRFGLSGPVG